MTQTRHESNQLYRTVAQTLGLRKLAEAQGKITGLQPLPQTVQRYYDGYGPSPIPAPAFRAALSLAATALAANSQAAAVAVLNKARKR
jgi:hypothetical protein